MSHSQRILEALEALGNATTSEITEATGLPPWPVLHHLYTLEKFRIVVDLGTVGFREEHRWRLTA